MSEIDPKSAKPRKKISWARFGGKFLVISVLVHVIFLSGAGYLVVQTIMAKRKLTFQAGPPSPNPANKTVEHRVQMRKETSMSAPQMAKRITVAGNLGKINLPEMPEMPTQNDDVKPMKMSGKDAGFGMGPGVGTGSGGPGGPGGASFVLPPIMADRCSAEGRLKEIQENGGDPKSETSILNALRWLKQVQNPDGSFGDGNKGGYTGLALLAFLGHCEKPSSGEFGPTVKNAIDCLVTQGTAAGNLAFGDTGNSWAYSHGIGAYALGEAYILTHDDRIPPILTKAIAIIVNGQRGDGGWSYKYSRSEKPDNSVTCWQIQALKTAHYSGLNLSGVDQALEKSMKFLVNMQGENGIFGYNKPGEGAPTGGHDMTGGSVFCLLIWHHVKDGAVRDGLKVLKEGALKQKKAPPRPHYEYKDAANLYAWYYNTQACFQAGGYHWSWWNRQFSNEVMNNQKPDGTWPPVGGKPPGFLQNKDDTTGNLFRTTLCVLMLEVYYRYLSTSKSEGSAQ